MSGEHRHRALMSFDTMPTNPVPPELRPYFKFLTPHAFDFVMSQHSKSLTAQFTACSEDTFTFTSHHCTISTTPDSCGYRVFRSKGLPCKHILYVRRWLDLAFDETLIDRGWSRLTHMTHCNSLLNAGTVANVSISQVLSRSVKGCSILSQTEKYKKVSMPHSQHCIFVL